MRKPRFVKEYATYLLGQIESRDDITAEGKIVLRNRVELTVKYFERYEITVDDAMVALGSVNEYLFQL